MATYDSTTKDAKCIFCEIASGDFETPGIFWQDKDFMAFLSIDPSTLGYSCVIPKKHYGSDVMKMPDEKLQEFIIAAKKVAKILEDYFEDVGRVGVMMEGTGIDHAHIKLFPMHGTEIMKNGGWQQILPEKEIYFDKYEGWMSSAGGPLANFEKLKSLADRLKTSQG